MAQAAPKHTHPAVSVSTTDRLGPDGFGPDGFGKVAAGGPIADLQRTLEQRLLAADRPLAPGAEDAGIAHRFSRLAGPALLVAAYAGVALWWF